MVLLMAMLDESFTPGVFQQKLEQGLRENELPHIRYTPEPGTANRVMQLFANNNGTPTEPLTHPTPPQPPSTHTQQAGTSRAPTATAYVTKYTKDTSKHEKKKATLNKKNTNTQHRHSKYPKYPSPIYSPVCHN